MRTEMWCVVRLEQREVHGGESIILPSVVGPFASEHTADQYGENAKWPVYFVCEIKEA